VVSAQSDSHSDAAAPLIGAWRYVGTRIDGKLRADRGDNPAGIIIYDRSGHMAVQIMPGKEQRATAPMSHFLAYFGTYSIDASATMVTHHRAGDIRPDAPTDVVREYEIVGDRLTLRPVGTTQEVMWERIK
jgi:Lipocalin-like domain